MSQKTFDFLLAQGPLIIALILQYRNAQKVQAQQDLKHQVLQNQIAENHAQVQKQFAGLSDADVIKSIAGPGSNT